MIALAAHESGLDQEFIDSLHKESPEILQSLYLSTNVVRYAIEAQDKIIKKIADSGSCVIVGRAGSYVLKDYKNVIKIFVKAPKEFRIKRVMEVYNDTEKDAKNYDLVLDSSIGLEESANIIVECFLNSKSK